MLVNSKFLLAASTSFRDGAREAERGRERDVREFLQTPLDPLHIIDYSAGRLRAIIFLHKL